MVVCDRRRKKWPLAISCRVSCVPTPWVKPLKPCYRRRQGFLAPYSSRSRGHSLAPILFRHKSPFFHSVNAAAMSHSHSHPVQKDRGALVWRPSRPFAAPLSILLFLWLSAPEMEPPPPPPPPRWASLSVHSGLLSCSSRFGREALDGTVPEVWRVPLPSLLPLVRGELDREDGTIPHAQYPSTAPHPLYRLQYERPTRLDDFQNESVPHRDDAINAKRWTSVEWPRRLEAPPKKGEGRPPPPLWIRATSWQSGRSLAGVLTASARRRSAAVWWSWRRSPM